LTVAGKQPAAIVLHFTFDPTVFASVWTTCSIEVYDVLRFQDSDLVQTLTPTSAAALSPNGTVSVSSARVLIALVGTSCGGAKFGVSWKSSSGMMISCPKKKKELCARSRGGLDDTLSFC
jgi:hypothetical protein